jgi:hypothetical protein
MAEPTKMHAWINTAISAIALLIASGSAVVSYRTYNLNSESIGLLSGTPTYDCLPAFGSYSSPTPGKPTSTIGLCWKVIVANQSTARTSIVDFEDDGTNKIWLPLVAGVLTDKGALLSTPFALDGGEARTITVRIMVPGTPLLEKMIKDFGEATNKNRISLKDFAYYAAQNNLDVLGNPVEKQDSEWVILVTFPTSYKDTTVSLRLKTGRGNTFSTELHFPGRTFDAVGRPGSPSPIPLPR